MSSATDNKQLMQDIFSELSKGNFEPFFAAMAEDMQWTWMGTMQWSKTFKGKKSVVNELFGAVKTTLTEPFKTVAQRFIGEGDYVVVEHSGQNTTPDGRPYNNKYCWVCRFDGGKLREIHEYMDTELVTATFSTNGKS
jgi:uncharacterized protein